MASPVNVALGQNGVEIGENSGHVLDALFIAPREIVHDRVAVENQKVGLGFVKHLGDCGSRFGVDFSVVAVVVYVGYFEDFKLSVGAEGKLMFGCQ